MWQAEPGWHPMAGGTGTSTLGVWRTVVAGRPYVVKRIVAPGEHDPAGLHDRHHPSYWKRAALVASSGIVESTPGLRSTTLTDVVEDAANSGLFGARALGRFAGADLGDVRWLARGHLRERVLRTERRGGWRVLARTTVADVADHLWQRRGDLLDRLDALPQVAVHGDSSPANLPGRAYDDVLAIDWATLGRGPVGADLAHLVLQSREGFEPMLDAYLLGLPDALATRDEVVLGVRVTAVFTALSRAEWALARVAGGEGALAGKYRHPAVAPHLRVLQRQFPQIEALVGGA